MTKTGNTINKNFRIPIKGLSISPFPDVIHIMFQITTEKDGKWTYVNYPDCSRTFEKAYEIKIK